MPSTGFGAPVLWLLFFSVLQAEGFACIGHLPLPKYPALLRAARLSGEIVCRATPASRDGATGGGVACVAGDKRFRSTAAQIGNSMTVRSRCLLAPMVEVRILFRIVDGDGADGVERYRIQDGDLVVEIGPMAVSG